MVLLTYPLILTSGVSACPAWVFCWCYAQLLCNHFHSRKPFSDLVDSYRQLRSIRVAMGISTLALRRTCLYICKAHPSFHRFYVSSVCAYNMWSCRWKICSSFWTFRLDQKLWTPLGVPSKIHPGVQDVSFKQFHRRFFWEFSSGFHMEFLKK